MAFALKQLFTKISHINNLKSFNNALSNLHKRQAFNILNRIQLYQNQPTPYEIVDSNEHKLLQRDVLEKIKNQIVQCEHGRLFAVVQVTGKQFKITEGDVIVIEGYWPPDVGDKISLDKVLVLGASDFTLIGRPLVQEGLASIHATVIEKSLSHTKTNFKKKRRKNYMRTHFYRIPQTFLRINSIQIIGDLNNPPEVSGEGEPYINK